MNQRSTNTREWMRAVVIAATATAALLHSAPARAQTDTTPPTCTVHRTTGTPPQIIITVQDTGSGLATIKFIISNGTIVIPPFTMGQTTPVVITATKTNLTSRAPFTVTLLITDVAGNQTLCDPLLDTLVIPPSHGWVTQTYSQISSREGHISIQNGSPGVAAVRVAVNGNWSQLYWLSGNQTLQLDVSAQLRQAGLNTISFSAFGNLSSTPANRRSGLFPGGSPPPAPGAPGSSVSILISDH